MTPSQVTDVSDPDLYHTWPMYVERNRVVVTGPSNVAVGESFTATMTVYADSGNTRVNGALFPREQTYFSIDPYISSSSTSNFTTTDTWANSNGQTSIQYTINTPGCFTIGDYTARTPPIYVHPVVNGVQQPLPDYVILPVDSQIYIDDRQSGSLRFNVYFGANTTAAAMPGNVTITSNDPLWVPPIVPANPGYFPINGPFSIYTGNAGGLSVTFTSQANASWTQTFNIKTFAFLNFEVANPRVNPSDNITISVYASRKDGTLLPQATERIRLTFLDSYTVYGYDYYYGGEVDVCKPMVNGRVEFNVNICAEGLYQLLAQHCDFLGDYLTGTPRSPVLLIGNQPVLSQIGIAPLAPTPFISANCAPLLVTPSSPPSSGQPSSSGQPGGKSSGIKWYIPVAAVLGALFLLAIVAALLVYIFVIRKKDKEDYVVRG